MRVSESLKTYLFFRLLLSNGFRIRMVLRTVVGYEVETGNLKVFHWKLEHRRLLWRGFFVTDLVIKMTALVDQRAVVQLEKEGEI